MKKLFISFAICSISAISFAQSNINKGDWMVGGDVGFNSSKDEFKSGPTTFTFNTTTLSASPNIGYFFINQLAGGLRASLSTSTEKDKNASPSPDEKLSTTVVGPFLRYYFMPSTQKVNVFVDGSYTFGSSKQTTGSTTSGKFNVDGYSFTGGVAAFLNPNVALEFGLGYTSLKSKDKTTSASTGVSENKSFGLNIGFQIHLAGSKMGNK